MIRAGERREAKRAWLHALLQRAKELPEMGELMDRVSGARDAEQDPEEQMSVARRIAASFASTVEEGA